VTAVYICERPLAYSLVHEIKYTIVFVRDAGFLSPSGKDKTVRHAAFQRTATVNIDLFPILRAGAFVTSLAGVVHSSPIIFVSPTQYTTTRVSFPMCELVTVPTLSAQCACLTALFMPWWAICALAYLAAVSPPRSAQLPNGAGVGGNGVYFERAAGGEGCS